MLKFGKAEITPKKIFLLLIREAYLFFRNLLGFTFHPYKTLRTIRREEDVSQAILLSSWPFPLWLGLTCFLILVKFFLQPTGIFNLALKLLFIFYTLFSLLYFLHLISWFIFYLKIQREMKKRGER